MAASVFPIIVISLASSTDRRIRAGEQLQTSQNPWQFLDAIDGRLAGATPHYDHDRRMRLTRRPMTSGEIGCFLSHRSAWKLCVERASPTVVLEDDFRLQPTFWPSLRVADQCSGTFDLLRLQGTFVRKERVLRKFHEISLVKQYVDPAGSMAYVVTPQCAQVLLARSEKFCVPVDDFIGATWLHRQRVRALKPYPVDTTDSASTIGDRTSQKLTIPQKLARELNRIPIGLGSAIWRHVDFYWR